MYSYDRRAAARPRFEVEHSADQVWVGLATPTEDVGYIILKDLSGHRLKDTCQANVEALQAEVFSREVPIYRVSDVQVEDDWQSQGWGIKLYERALKAAAPAIIVTGGCTGMGTDPSALRVWKSLARRYPVKGQGDTLALAVV